MAACLEVLWEPSRISGERAASIDSHQRSGRVQRPSGFVRKTKSTKGWLNLELPGMNCNSSTASSKWEMKDQYNWIWFKGSTWFHQEVAREKPYLRLGRPILLPSFIPALEVWTKNLLLSLITWASSNILPKSMLWFWWWHIWKTWDRHLFW